MHEQHVRTTVQSGKLAHQPEFFRRPSSLEQPTAQRPTGCRFRGQIGTNRGGKEAISNRFRNSGGCSPEGSGSHPRVHMIDSRLSSQRCPGNALNIKRGSDCRSISWLKGWHLMLESSTTLPHLAQTLGARENEFRYDKRGTPRAATSWHGSAHVCKRTSSCE